jgi:hypothetical protein
MEAPQATNGRFSHDEETEDRKDGDAQDHPLHHNHNHHVNKHNNNKDDDDESVPTEEALSESLDGPSASIESISAMSYRWLLRGSSAFTSSRNESLWEYLAARCNYYFLSVIPVEVLSIRIVLCTQSKLSAFNRS